MYCFMVYLSLLRMLTLGGDEEHLIGPQLKGQKYFGGAMRGALGKWDGLPVFDAAWD